ncbi:hypothetical protein Tco_1079964 [Tanacetum coccineum]|uniref:CCHC-type domain-containing protein n=1 Tax=Tanacetum coccineum TaxID=301880 RepID=A0ABQ5HTJ9_9ASTR
MATMAENVIAAGSETCPLMLEKGMYDSWKTRIMLCIQGKDNGEMLQGLVINGPYKFKSEITTKDINGVTDIRREERLEDLKGDGKLRYDSDIKAVNILLLGLPVDIYTLINYYQTTKEIWDRVKELMKGTKMTKQDCESMLYDEFDKFTYRLGESIHSYYLRYAKLINDMNMIPMSMTPIQINTNCTLSSNTMKKMLKKFKKCVNDSQKDLLCCYAPPVVQQPPTFQPDIGLAILAFLPTDDPIASLNKAMIFLRAQVINTVGNTRANQPRVIKCYNCKGECHMAKQCTARKRVKDSEWFKEKMLLAQAQEAGVVLDEEQQDFLAGNLEETDDCKNLQLQATSNFKAYHIDAYDSKCDDEATTNAIFMENLSLVGSLNDETVAPRYDSNTLSKVPHYNTYHDSDMLNSSIQELGYIENIISTNESYDELKGNSDVISYTYYMITIRDDADNYVLPPVQKNDMMLSVIEQMKSQVEKCTKVNQESKSEIESLTNELERYKERVKILGYEVKDGHSEQEAYLNRELYTFINDRNKKVKDFEKQVFSQETQMKNLNNHIAFLKKNFETLKQESFESPPVTVSKPKVFPKKLQSTSQVLRKPNKAQDLLTKFDECIKRRTTLYPHDIGSWEQSDIKDIFEQMKDEVYQCSVAKQSFEIEKKQLLINNDRLLEEYIASDIMRTYLHSVNEVDNCRTCKSLDIVLLDLQESNKS